MVFGGGAGGGNSAYHSHYAGIIPFYESLRVTLCHSGPTSIPL